VKIPFAKAHGARNDFLLTWRDQLPVEARDSAALARAICERHTGIGADGWILTDAGVEGAHATIELWNSDGSRSEISGNGTRCAAALVVQTGKAKDEIRIATGAGIKTLRLLDRQGRRFEFRAAMGEPENIRETSIELDGQNVRAVVLRVGNPQCVVLGPVTEERLKRIAGPLAVHPIFPEGTNVELADVEAPDRVRVLIWERGVGPTEASGTGACAAAVAAAAFGGAARAVDVISPGGSQRVEWTDQGVWLTGWAEIIATGDFL